MFIYESYYLERMEPIQKPEEDEANIMRELVDGNN